MRAQARFRGCFRARASTENNEHPRASHKNNGEVDMYTLFDWISTLERPEGQNSKKYWN